MVFYITIYILASLFAFLYSKIESKNLAFIFKWTSFLILFLPIALRYNSRNKNCKLDIYALAFLFSVLFLVTIKNAVITDEGGGLGLVPYQSIFER